MARNLKHPDLEPVSASPEKLRGWRIEAAVAPRQLNAGIAEPRGLQCFRLYKSTGEGRMAFPPIIWK